MNIKTKLDIAKQKVTGIAQQMQGEVKVASGQHIEGTIDKVRGKANEIVADLRNKVENSK